jgi:hypothetical protein
MSDKGLLEIAQRLLVDRDFREQFLIAPGAVLADLGMSEETYRALATVVPALLVGGVALIVRAGEPLGTDGTPISWGRG